MYTFNRASINMLEVALKKMIFGNNQHKEGLIKNIKTLPDLHLHTKELATYIWWFYKNCIKSLRKLIVDYQGCAHILERRMGRRKKKDELNSNSKSQDAIRNDTMNENCGNWDVRGYLGVRGENMLRIDLTTALDKALAGERNGLSLRYYLVKSYSEKKGVGSMSGFCEGTFKKWIKDTWNRPKKGVPKAAMAAMIAFKDAVTNEQDFSFALSEAKQIRDDINMKNREKKRR